MARKIIGVTVGTPINPQAAMEKTQQAADIEALKKNKLDANALADWAKQPTKPSYTASEVGAMPSTTKIPSKPEDVGAEASGTADSKVSAHNTASDAHNDIRLLIEALTTRLNAFFDSDDTTLDELSEIVEYIKSNKSLIDSITTSKVSVSDIINNLTTNATNKPLSAAQGVVLKSLIDALSTAKLDANALADWAKQAKKPSYTASEVGALPSTTPIPSKPEDIGAASAAAVQQLSEEIDDQQEQVNSLTLGIASDGLIYLFKGGSPVGTGIPQGQSGDVFGYVDENNTIVLTGNLADGTYSLKYELEDGSTLDIGKLELGEEDDGNLLPKATNADGSPYVGDNGEKGYNTGYRIKSSGEQVAQANTCCTGFIPVTFNDKIYVKDITMNGTASYNSIVFYDSSKTKLYNTAFATSGYAWVTYTGGVFCFTVNQMSTSAQNAAYFRLCCGGITDETIITVNKPIA